MTHPDHSARRGPARRGDSTRPASTRSAARRGGARRPYPTASTTTRVSPAKPGPARARSRSRGSASTPTPATVWTAGPAPIDLGAAWPTPIITKIVGAFSEPGERVVLLPWPTCSDRSRPAPAGADAAIDSPITTVPGAEPEDELADALATVNDLDRTGRVVHIPVHHSATGPGSRPFWADLVSGPDREPATIATPPRAGSGNGMLDGAEAASADTDLVITSLRPEHGGNHSSDLVALAAARLLRVGGILVVLTRCDWRAGELIDPTGAVIASAQNADLLYLQHIVALHAPVRDGRFAPELLAEDGRAIAEDEARTRHRAAVRGLPTPHRRIHSDALAFAQPHEYKPLAVSPTEQTSEPGTIR